MKSGLGKLIESNWAGVHPCFVLSTGRCGTKMLTRLLNMSPDANAVHVPMPELINASKMAYENVLLKRVFVEIFRAAREEYVFDAVVNKKIFIETNNRISFFVPYIRDVFPEARFIHLVRHPGDFVRSGLRRGWYTGKHPYDFGRIKPSGTWWDRKSGIEKISWLWNETNEYICKYMEDGLVVKAEDLFSDPLVTKEIYDYIGLRGFSERRVRKAIKTPENKQYKSWMPEYEKWPEYKKLIVGVYTPSAKKYGYTL